MVSSTPRPHFTPGKDPVPIVQEAGWAPGPVWTGEKSRPHRDSIPDRPARSQSLYRLSYPAHTGHYVVGAKFRERLEVNKQTTQKFDVDRFNFRKLNDLEVRKQYQIEISDRLAALEN